jgi:hypothetical protein
MGLVQPRDVSNSKEQTDDEEWVIVNVAVAVLRRTLKICILL